MATTCPVGSRPFHRQPQGSPYAVAMTPGPVAAKSRKSFPPRPLRGSHHFLLSPSPHEAALVDAVAGFEARESQGSALAP